MNPLQQIPSGLRTWLYWTGYLVGVVSQGTTVVWAAVAATDPDVEMPLALVITSAVLAFLQTQLNLVSGSNVNPPGNTALIEAPAEVTITADPLPEDRHDPLGPGADGLL